MPYECPRCGEAFMGRPGLDDHLQGVRHCKNRERIVSNAILGLKISQQEQLRQERRHCPDEAAKWRMIYQIAFPHVQESDIPPACKPPSTLQQFGQR